MKLLYRAKRFGFESGEESAMLFGLDGMPLEMPVLYVMRKLRPKGDAANTIFNKMVAISVLYTWLDSTLDKGAGKQGINILERFRRGQHLSEDELESLKDFCGKSFNLSDSNDVSEIKAIKVVQSPRGNKKIHTMRTVDTPSVGSSTKYARMTYIGQYLKWLALHMANQNKRKVVKSTRMEVREMVNDFLEK